MPFRYLPFQSDTVMKRISTIILFAVLTLPSCSQKPNSITQIENKHEIVDGKKQIVGQTIKTLRQGDSLPIKVITKIFNYENDLRLKYTTGLSKEDGLQEYLMDSIFYDNNGNDTMKKSFVRLSNNWQPTQIFYNRFRSDNKVDYFMTERPFKQGYYFKKEIFYTYYDKGNLFTETEVECRQRNVCDSTFKRKYFYNSSGKLDSTLLYSWRHSSWTQIKKINGR
jgi:hypothetical protein